jgi:hypothetical protein
MYFDVNKTKICRNHYKSSTGFLGLLKSVMTILLVGESPIASPSAKRRVH